MVFLFLQLNPTRTDSCQSATWRYNAKEDLFQTICFKKRKGENIIDKTDVFPIQVYMITSASITKSIKSYTTDLEYKVEYARGLPRWTRRTGSHQEAMPDPGGEPYAFPRVEYSGQETGHLATTTATKNKQKNPLNKVLVNNLIASPSMCP